MGGHWLPDPPLGFSLSDEISAPPVVVVDSDNEDGIDVENDNEPLNNVNEYRLLTDGDGLDWEGVDHSDEENEVSNTIPDSSSVSLRFGTTNEERSVDEQIVNIEPRDIEIDCDKVKAAMANITLPASATPSWAANIPDSEWCSYLQSRIRSLQEHNPCLDSNSKVCPK